MDHHAKLIGFGCLAVIALLGPAAVRANDPPPPMVPVRDSLTPVQVDRALRAASEVQGCLAHCTGVFRIRQVVDLNALPSGVLQAQPQLAYNGGVAEATMRWWRQGVWQRIETVYDLPAELRRHSHEDLLVVTEPERQVMHVLRTDQIAVLPPGDPACLSPMDWLAPGDRRPLSALGTQSGLAMFCGFSTEDDRVLLRAGPDSAEQGSGVDILLDPELGHAIMGWQLWDGSATCAIDWTTGVDGRVHPRRAELAVWNAERTRVVRQMTLDTVAWSAGADVEAIRFGFRPGMVYTDNREQNAKGEVPVYRVLPDGGRELLPNLSMAAVPLATAPSMLTLGLVGAVVIAMATGRILRLRRAPEVVEASDRA